jgi:hypothetical protein
VLASIERFTATARELGVKVGRACKAFADVAVTIGAGVLVAETEMDIWMRAELPAMDTDLLALFD